MNIKSMSEAINKPLDAIDRVHMREEGYKALGRLSEALVMKAEIERLEAERAECLAQLKAASYMLRECRLFLINMHIFKLETTVALSVTLLERVDATLDALRSQGSKP